MTFYGFLLFVHIFSAILGMGPGLVMTFVVKYSKASTMAELRTAFRIRNGLHILTMIGGTLLLLTGLLMGSLNTALFSQGWYVTSLILFLIALASGPLLLKPKSAPIKEILATHEGENVPEEYEELSKKLFSIENWLNLIFLIIIALMILKPF